ncbi:type IV secretory pathway VirB10-like protein [Streptomyces sp. TE12347]
MPVEWTPLPAAPAAPSLMRIEWTPPAPEPPPHHPTTPSPPEPLPPPPEAPAYRRALSFANSANVRRPAAWDGVRWPPRLKPA